MSVLVVGATGATGRLLVQYLLNRGQTVKVIVRSTDRLPEAIRNHDRLSVIHASVLDPSNVELAEHVKGCTAVASCLGHNMSWQGIYGQPRRLVADATRRLCDAIKANNRAAPTRFVLMNTAGNRNRDLNEPNLLYRNTKVIVEQNLGDDSKLTSTANPDRVSLRLVQCGRSGVLPASHRETDPRVCAVDARGLLHPHSRLAILPTCWASVRKR